MVWSSSPTANRFSPNCCRKRKSASDTSWNSSICIKSNLSRYRWRIRGLRSNRSAAYNSISWKSTSRLSALKFSKAMAKVLASPANASGSNKPSVTCARARLISLIVYARRFDWIFLGLCLHEKTWEKFLKSHFDTQLKQAISPVTARFYTQLFPNPLG